ncbi:hypothetical protein CWI75_12220 [Kineobactrum sediminis]|uniref:Uncharacterized protein n=1 Tax=Kineobactrum sediminis TaxID=1905677 RepID=A0A2N5Y2B8_9GAMM|nr:hypothetical protein [Kineobactrum sediminis]PLW82509.1 hypothetical protein CWI75_12220 [Kineobactrum sediminis]
MNKNIQLFPFSRRRLAITISMLASGATLVAGTALAQDISPPWESPVHVFSIQDLQSGFDGSTFGPAGAAQDPDAICGLPGGTACPATTDPATGLPLVAPFTDKDGVILYPVDSEFGFEVVDFLGAQAKTREAPRDYQEGFVGNIFDGAEVVGIKISNFATDTYKVKPPMGTWCQGLGGTSVKCSTEHYVVMEHTLSCHEVVPYFFADPTDGSQAYLSLPDGSDFFSCADAELDDNASILVNGMPIGGLLTDVKPGVQMDANDNTTVRNDIAVSSDYSITLKDDGKPLYRWGALIKRPNDVRLYARLPLPDAWKEPDADYQIESAKLVVTHWITNNPNDQLRPEDLENEAATGRKPSYRVDAAGNWVSTRECYEGDGDFIDSEEGSSDPGAIGVGTIFKNNSTNYSIPAGINPPEPFSSDLVGGFTNAFYTSINRDPFEWSYVDPVAAASGEFEFIGTALPLSPVEVADRGLELVSGPRWRLKANKFGQDIPGLEIPLIECSAPPFARENVRYEVGETVTTVINLLDWDESEGPSPLATSKGWVDVLENDFVTVADTINGVPVTTNGLPMTNDFDLAVYVKGDRKPTAVFTAQLIINEDVEVPVPDSDMSITNFKVPSKVNTLRSNILISAVVGNDPSALASGSGTVNISGIDGTGAEVGNFSASFSDIEPGKKENFKFRWTSPAQRTEVLWTATVTVDGQVVSSAQGMTLVRDKG